MSRSGLPTLQRAVAIAEPMEGTVERLGRALDRMPGEAGRGPQLAPETAPPRRGAPPDPSHLSKPPPAAHVTSGDAP